MDVFMAAVIGVEIRAEVITISAKCDDSFSITNTQELYGIKYVISVSCKQVVVVARKSKHVFTFTYLIPELKSFMMDLCHKTVPHFVPRICQIWPLLSGLHANPQNGWFEFSGKKISWSFAKNSTCINLLADESSQIELLWVSGPIANDSNHFYLDFDPWGRCLFLATMFWKEKRLTPTSSKPSTLQHPITGPLTVVLKSKHHLLLGSTSPSLPI